MSHGKTLKLQQITVKVPGQHASSVSRTTTTPTSSELTESVTVTSSQPGNISDRSNSTSPPPGLESSLDMSYNSNSGLTSLPASFPPRITHTSPQHPPPLHQAYQDYHGNRQLGHEVRDYRSPASSERDEFGSSDLIEDSSSYSGSTGGQYLYTNGRGHNRNGSVDDTIMLQQLRQGGKLACTCVCINIQCTYVYKRRFMHVFCTDTMSCTIDHVFLSYGDIVVKIAQLQKV
jgi:hypothetical protein